MPSLGSVVVLSAFLSRPGAAGEDKEADPWDFRSAAGWGKESGHVHFDLTQRWKVEDESLGQIDAAQLACQPTAELDGAK